MSRGARIALGSIAVLLLLAGSMLLWYALSPFPVEKIQSTVDPTFMVLPLEPP